MRSPDCIIPLIRFRRAPRWVRSLVGGGLLLSLVVAWRLQYALVLTVGTSMQPTLANGELLLVARRAYTRRSPQRGDIVVARYGNEFITKRIVGLPGERVELVDGELWIDGSPLPAPHETTPGRLTIAPGTLSPERYALVGDNRSQPTEQSVHAVVSRDQLLGRVVASWRPGQARTTPRTSPDPADSLGARPLRKPVTTRSRLRPFRLTRCRRNHPFSQPHDNWTSEATVVCVDPGPGLGRGYCSSRSPARVRR
jgi:signal peptidase I